MKRFNFFLISISVVLFCMSGPAAAKEADLPDVTVDGLHRVPDSKMAIVYAEPGADLSQYKRINLLDAYVAFKKNWERDRRQGSISASRVTSKDMENIKNRLAQEFQTVFSKTLQDGGYDVVDESAEDVLLLRPAIINLDVNAPDTPRAGMTRTYASSAGEMTLYVELYDSVTGDLIAKALDRRVDNQTFYTWTNSVTNKSAADKILAGWAKILLDALNEAKQP
ncbi:DUF3313 family protein [Pseudomonadota bacterium]